MSPDLDDRCPPWTVAQFTEAMQASPAALQALLRKMALDLNNLRSDVKNVAKKLFATIKEKRGAKTGAELHGIIIQQLS